MCMETRPKLPLVPPPCRICAEEEGSEPAFDQSIIDGCVLRALDNVLKAWDTSESAKMWLIQNLKTIEHQSSRGNIRIIQAVAKLLEHPDEEVRQLVGPALQQVGTRPKGDAYAIDLVAARLSHKDPDVRRAAIEALRQISDSSDEPALDFLCGAFQDEDFEVRAAALDTLGAIFRFDRNRTVVIEASQSILNAVFSLLGDESKEVRSAACRTLSRIATKGDEDVCERLVPLLEDVQPSVQQAAMHGLRLIPWRGDEAAFAAIASKLHDPNSATRRTAVESLRYIVEAGGGCGLEDAMACLSDPSFEVRNQAVNTVIHCATMGDESIVQCLLKQLENESTNQVRFHLLSGLHRIVRCGDRHAAAGVCSYLGTTNLIVRMQALSTLEQIADRGDQKTTKAVKQLLKDSEPQVCSGAARALAKISKNRRECTTATTTCTGVVSCLPCYQRSIVHSSRAGAD